MTIEKITERLFHTETGNIIISGLFGIGLAFMFSRACKGNNCIIIQPPNIDDVKDSIYQIQDECFKYNPKAIQCNSAPSLQHVK
jgi:hypothetical protein